MKKLFLALVLCFIFVPLAFAISPVTIYNLSLTNASRTGSVALSGYKTFAVRSDADVWMSYGTSGGSGAGKIKLTKDLTPLERGVRTDKVSFTCISSATPTAITYVQVEVEPN